MTDAERRLWAVLRTRGLESFSFTRQKIIGQYIVDFYCHRAKLVIEVDGGQHFSDKVAKGDKARDAYMKTQGLDVLRFSDTDVLVNTEGVITAILQRIALIENPLSSPFAKGGE